MNPTISQIQAIIADPALARNPRGQLAAALRLLDLTDQQQLACDFAEHGLWLCERVMPGDPRPHQALSTIRAYIRGNATWEEVASTDHDLMTYGYSIGDNTSFEGRVAYEAWWAIEHVMRVCCHAALKQARRGSWSRNQRLLVIDVAVLVAKAVGLDAAGEAWDAKDAQMRMNARKKGYQASNEEAQWQLNHLLDYVAQRA